jgi:nitroreductase
MSELLELIKSRKSVRSFDGRALLAEDRARLEQYMETISNPFGIPVRFVLLDAKEHALSSPVLTGETLYAAGLVAKGQNADLAFGFSFEKLVLYAWSLGIGTTWIGGTMKRELFERAAGLAEGEMMPCISPLGYPAKKRSVRESMMRRGVRADERMPADRLFFDGAWDIPYTPENEEIREALEMLRWAPSAVNRQPWRIVAKDGAFHFYEKQDRGYVSDKTGDLQKVDLGIALCHFVTGLESRGMQPEVLMQAPEIPVPDGILYVATVKSNP